MTTTKSGEPTFNVPAHKTVMVEDHAGTRSAAYHDNDTWWLGQYSETPECAPLQLEHPPVRLV